MSLSYLYSVQRRVPFLRILSRSVLLICTVWWDDLRTCSIWSMLGCGCIFLSRIVVVLCVYWTSVIRCLEFSRLCWFRCIWFSSGECTVWFWLPLSVLSRSSCSQSLVLFVLLSVVLHMSLVVWWKLSVYCVVLEDLLEWCWFFWKCVWLLRRSECRWREGRQC